MSKTFYNKWWPAISAALLMVGTFVHAFIMSLVPSGSWVKGPLILGYVIYLITVIGYFVHWVVARYRENE